MCARNVVRRCWSGAGSVVRCLKEGCADVVTFLSLSDLLVLQKAGEHLGRHLKAYAARNFTQQIMQGRKWGTLT